MKKVLKKLIQKTLFGLVNKNWIVNLLDLNYNSSSKAILDIFNDYGYTLSLKKTVPLNSKEEALPWYTYPAIEYLLQFDLRNKIVFEWGCGNSSLFFASRAKEVISLEDNKDWFDKIKALKPENLTLIFAEGDEYVNKIRSQNKKFDIIVIDASQRIDCAIIALDYLALGGLIILDNSDWYKNSAKVIRENNMIQVDFHGFGPINNYTWTTSIFFSRDFNFEAKNNLQPAYAIGGLTHICD